MRLGIWAGCAGWLLIGCAAALAQGPANVLVVVNGKSTRSQEIASYYMRRRGVPGNNACRIEAPREEEISRAVYRDKIEMPIASFLQRKGLTEQILYIVTTLDVPLRIAGEGGQQRTTAAAVDSELAALYLRLKGEPAPLPGPLHNPMFGQTGRPFRHPDVPLYMVTRLAGYDVADVKGMIDGALAAVNKGKVVIDLRAEDVDAGNAWLRAAAARIPKARLLLESTGAPVYDVKDVIAYASWGSNDPGRHRRTLGFRWLPGAILTEFVSTDGRTFVRPPPRWNIGAWNAPATWFAGSPQTLAADEIAAGVTGASAHVAEPFLPFTPRPDLVIPAYLSGRNLADSFYAGIRAISWQNIVLGDPLCRLAPPR